MSGDRGLDESAAGAAFSDPSAAPIDLAFLDEQTFGDADLRREILGLFVAQARRVVPRMPQLGAAAQADAAHLLRGSAKGIGAWTAAAAALAYEAAAPIARAALYPAIQQAFARVEEAAAKAIAATEA